MLLYWKPLFKRLAVMTICPGMIFELLWRTLFRSGHPWKERARLKCLWRELKLTRIRYPGALPGRSDTLPASCLGENS